MTNKRSYFSTYRAISAGVEVGSKHELHVEGIGDILVRFQTDAGPRDLWLRNAYYVPTLQYNLFSVQHQLAQSTKDPVEARIEVSVNGKRHTGITIDHGTYHAVLDSSDKLYKLKFECAREDHMNEQCLSVIESRHESDAVLWHRRLAHPGKAAFYFTLNNIPMSLGLKSMTAPNRLSCPTCIIAKLTRKSFVNKHRSYRQWGIGEKGTQMCGTHIAFSLTVELDAS